MKQEKKHFLFIDIIRVLSCLAVLLYHIGILKGGYLAVCVFFVLSGYLSVRKAFSSDKFSLKGYYKDRFIKIYLPLLIIVFLSIFAVSFFPSINWFNLKPETTSVILGYNNFWQLNANMDYFARHINSPFIHLWYISILIQFEIVFPYIFLLFKRIGDKTKKHISCLLTLILSILGAILFYQSSISQDLMYTYYGTLERIFSLMFGVTIGFIHSYYRPLIFKRIKEKELLKRIIFLLYSLLLAFLIFTVDAQSKYFALSMIASTLISVRLIDYAVSIKNENGGLVFKLASASYWVYLVQYPIIFLLQYTNIRGFYYPFIVIILSLLLGCLFNFITNYKNKNGLLKVVSFLILMVLTRLCFSGVYQYITMEDHSKEMRVLEKELAENEKLVEARKEEYARELEKENDDWSMTLASFEKDASEIDEIVSNLHVVGIGDSVMLGAIDHLNEKFSNGYFDAKISRTAWVVGDIIDELKAQNMFGNPVVLNLGANGDCSESCKAKIIEKCGDRDIFWVNVTNDEDVHVNSKLDALAKEHSNIHIVDWNAISNGHPEYFIVDGIHLTESGRIAYTDAIYDTIHKTYVEELTNKKNIALKEHDDKLKNKVSFFGNDILLNAFDEIENNFSNANFNTNKKYNFDLLKKDIQESIKSDNLNHKVAFVFDSSIKFNRDELGQLFELCKGHELYFLTTNKCMSTLIDNNFKKEVNTIDFYRESKDDEEYFVADKIHLSKKGNKLLSDLLLSNIK